MRASPAFPFYVDNFIEGTCDFEPHDVGCYTRLLCYQWTRGKIPRDAATLTRIAGGRVSRKVLAKFKHGKNARLEKEREKQRIWRLKSSAGGKASAAKRGATTLEPPLQPPAQPKGNIPFPLPSPTIKTTKLPASDKNGAEKFTPWMTDITAGFHHALGLEWENDRQKWMTRIKRHTGKAARVLAEVKSAASEARIKTSPARYAEQTWKEFK